MKKLLLIALCTVFNTNAFALDSDWKICKGEVILFDDSVNLVVNAYEHRIKKGRAADITFIYGSHILRGSYSTTDSTSGAITLKGNNNSVFTGNIAIDYGRGLLTLTGNVVLNRESSDVRAVLECETL